MIIKYLGFTFINVNLRLKYSSSTASEPFEKSTMKYCHKILEK